METANRSRADGVDWTRIAAFYFIACVAAYPFNGGWFGYPASRYVPSSFAYVPAALGLGIAALIFWGSLGDKALVTLTGGKTWASLLFCLTPVAAFTLTGIEPQANGPDPHVLGLIYAGINLAYAILEEAGWRGYLQNATRPLPELTRFVITGLLWWPWHMRFGNNFERFVFPLIVVASAIGLGKVAEQTRSFLTSAGLHLLIILISNTGGGWSRKAPATILCLVAWFFLLRGWKRVDGPRSSGAV